MADRPTDSEMLDWLERHANPAYCSVPGYNSGKVRDVVTGKTYEADTLRDAIAAAMSASSQPEPDTR